LYGTVLVKPHQLPVLELHFIILLKFVFQRTKLRRNIDIFRFLIWPVATSKNLCREFNTSICLQYQILRLNIRLWLLLMLLILLQHLLRFYHIFKHCFYLIDRIMSTLNLQLFYHKLFRFVAQSRFVDQTHRQEVTVGEDKSVSSV